MNESPIIAAISSFCPNHSHAIPTTSTMPTPDHNAYAMLTEMVLSASDEQ